jgi:hypothetical protein
MAFLKKILSTRVEVRNIHSINPNKLLIATQIKLGTLKLGRTDFTESKSLLQVASLLFKRNQEIERHKHLPLFRETEGTSEIWIVIKGKFEVSIYDFDATLIEQFIISKKHLVIFYSGGHSLRSLQSKSELLEIKNGPYFGAEADKLIF